MKLSHMTWKQVEDHINNGGGVVLPTGSTEQHGPMGMIGTDTICAGELAERAAQNCGSICAPALAYTPAPFNMHFPGTMSLSSELFTATLRELLLGLEAQGFSRIYILNGHGANLEPAREAQTALTKSQLCIRSWWDFEEVNVLRRQWYGQWEGMHATPSEIAITQALYEVLPEGEAATPPKALTSEYIAAHAGDRHGPPDEHRAEFPDGRVGSHSALARPEHGAALIDVATKAIARDMAEFFETA